MLRFLVALSCGLALAGSELRAAAPDDTRPEAYPVENAVALDIQPKSVTLTGTRASLQLLVTGRYADGSLRDLTRFCDWKGADPDLFEITSQGLVTGRGEGTTHLKVHVAGLEAEVPITVRRGASQPVSFRREVMPVLSSAGCSDIRCHGAPSGKNGFRLSLWGSDPELDYQQLTRDGFGRRTDAFVPANSLILLKALTRVSHAGGKRFHESSNFANLLRDWQAEGLGDDPQSSQLRSFRVIPARRVLHAPGRRQQLAVRATFEDGRTVDVTRLTTFSSTDLAVASVDRTGLVEFHYQGEVAILCRFLGKMQSVRLMHIASPLPDYRWTAPPANNYIDRHVFAKLRMLHIAPSVPCSDEQFVRRVYLDICGILPTPAETRAFLSDTRSCKRSRLIDQLLQRPEYADYWTKKWMDVSRASRDSIQLVGAQAYYDWLRERIERDASLADVVREMLTSLGESYSDPAVNYYCVATTPAEVTDPHYLQKDLAEATAQLFLGVRLQCAQCHNHPYERWTQEDYLGLAAFFTQVQRSRLGKEGPKGRPDRRQMAIALNPGAAEITHESTGEAVLPRVLGDVALELDPSEDRRQVLADWLTRHDNPFFAKAIVNRIWFHLHGRGIVEPVDDFRNSNPASNEPLLDALAQDFISNGYRLRPLIRAIANSATYQLSSAASESDRNDGRYFSHMLARPLPAEVLLDAICEVTGVPESYEIMKDYIEGIPTESVKFPSGTRAVQLPVNDIVTLINTSGKYVRYESHPFLRIFGQPNRTQTCECDREQRFGRKQALEMIVGPMVSHKLARADNRLGEMLARQRPASEILGELYLRALCRLPSESTAEAFLEHVATSAVQRQAWEDVLWTVLNSQEFIYQH